MDELMELTRAAMQRSGLTLYEIAKRAGLSYSRVHDVANETRPTGQAATLSRIIAACGFGVRLVRRPAAQAGAARPRS